MIPARGPQTIRLYSTCAIGHKESTRPNACNQRRRNCRFECGAQWCEFQLFDLVARVGSCIFHVPNFTCVVKPNCLGSTRWNHLYIYIYIYILSSIFKRKGFAARRLSYLRSRPRPRPRPRPKRGRPGFCGTSA